MNVSLLNLLKIAARVAKVFTAWSEPPGWEYFHVSAQDLGDSISLTPRIPDWVKNTDNEDFTTPRVCLAPSVKQAMHGRFGAELESAMPQEEMFVYAARSIPDIITPNSDGCPDDMPGNLYGPNWSWPKYAEWKDLDSKDKKVHADTVRGCIPDTSTGEVWSLQPVTMRKIGRLWNGPDGRIRAKWLLREKPESNVEDVPR